MMKKMKRLFVLTLAALMAIGLSACKQGNGHVNSNFDFEIGDTGGLKVPFGNGETIRMLAVDEVNSTSTYIFEKLSQVTGLTIQAELLPVSSAKDKAKIILSSGNLPDIMGTGVGTITEINDLASQGAFAAVDDYLKDMPNFRKLFGEGAEENWIFKSYTADDGKLYALPVYDMQREVNHGMLYRKDIFDKHNIPMWDSPETFYQALKTLKQAYPDTYPLTSKTGKNIIRNYGVSWGITPGKAYYDEAENSWKYSDTDPKMKEMLDYFRKLYDEGIIDPEFLTNTQAAWTSKMTIGNSFVTYDWIGRLDMFQEQTEIDGYDLRCANPVGPNQTVVTLRKVGDGGATVANNSNAGLSMKLLDFLFSDAGAELMTCGVRGETFEIGEDGMAKYLGFEEGKKVEISDLAEKYGMWMQGTYRKVDKRSGYFNFTEREKEAQELPKNHKGFEPADPVVTFQGDDISKIADYETRLSSKFDEVVFKYLIGQETGDEAWNNWLVEAKRLGEDDYIRLYNERQAELGL